MLTFDSFDCMVTKETIKGTPCWVYHGNDLGRAINFAQRVQAAGEKFFDPLTGVVSGVHTAVLDKAMVTLLIAMDHYHRYNEYSQMIYPDEFPVLDKGCRGFTGEYAYLVHFGLLSRERDGDLTSYQLTDSGREFIKGGKKIFPELFNTGGIIHGYDETKKRVNAMSFFTVREWAQMETPLWFLPDKFRREILTTEEYNLKG